MSDAAQIRAWGNENGYALGDKGRIPATVRQAYEEATGIRAAAPDYPDGMSEDDFTDPDGPPAGGDGQGDDPEARPRSTKPAGRGWKLPGRGKAKPRSKGGHAKPRVPVEETISNGWRLLARLARPLPPLERTLKVQAPVAGLLLEDAVRGTVVDAVLQPIARYQARGKTGAAMIGPPVLVTAITLHVQRQAMAGQPPNPFFMSTAVELLRESLMLWLEVAGPKFDLALAKEKEFEAKHGQSVDEMIAWLLSDPVDPRDPAAMKAEQDAMRRAWGQDPDTGKEVFVYANT
jgi:hypothetical protein